MPMRCEDVQDELARDNLSPAEREAVDSHVTGCDACRSAQLLFATIDATLRRAPAWQPPEGFERTVAALAGVAAPTRPAIGSFLSPDVIHAVTLGVLVATAVYVGGHVAAWIVPLDLIAGNAALMACTSIVASLGVVAWFARRSLA